MNFGLSSNRSEAQLRWFDLERLPVEEVVFKGVSAANPELEPIEDGFAVHLGQHWEAVRTCLLRLVKHVRHAITKLTWRADVVVSERLGEVWVWTVLFCAQASLQVKREEVWDVLTVCSVDVRLNDAISRHKVVGDPRLVENYVDFVLR